MGSNLVQILTVGSGVAASVAAWFAARMSRAAVERANLAFVWAELDLGRSDRGASTRLLRVQLHSDGPGIALDVRWSVGQPWERGRKAYRRAQEELAGGATPAIRALGPGMSYPALAVADGDEEEQVAASYITAQRYVHDDDEPWWVVVRWSDSAGRRWEFSEGSGGRDLAPPPRKVRRRPATWHPWWAQLLPAWWTWTQPSRMDRRERREW